MRRLPTWVLTVCVLVAGCGYDRAPTYEEPPADSYATGTYQLRIDGSVTSVEGAAVAPGFFGAAQAQPLIGRLLVDPDYASSARRVVVLSHDLWMEGFGSSPSVIGSEIELDGRQVTVIGVAPRGFRFPDGARLWTARSGGSAEQR